MPDWSSIAFDPHGFSGVARLFPLPNVVLFPHVVQPLHIFEPRYREMATDALASDQLIAVASLQPGWESKPEGTPPLAPIACLGKILAHARLEDGRFNLLHVGLCRVRIDRELPPTRPFRQARVTVLTDEYPVSGAAGRSALQQRLMEGFRRFVPNSQVAKQQFEQLMAQSITLGMLTDIMAFTLNFEVEVKQRLLGEVNCDRRAKLLLEHLEALRSIATSDDPAARLPFPPDFSDN